MKKFKKGSLISFAVTLAIVMAVLANSLLFSSVLANDGLTDEIIPETLTEVASLLPDDGEPADEPKDEPIDELGEKPVVEPSDKPVTELPDNNDKNEALTKIVLGKLTALGLDMTGFSLHTCFSVNEEKTLYNISLMGEVYFDSTLVEEYFANSNVQRDPIVIDELKERALNDENEMLVDFYSVFYDTINDRIINLIFCHGIKNVVYGGFTNIDSFVINLDKVVIEKPIDEPIDEPIEQPVEEPTADYLPIDFLATASNEQEFRDNNKSLISDVVKMFKDKDIDLDGYTNSVIDASDLGYYIVNFSSQAYYDEELKELLIQLWNDPDDWKGFSEMKERSIDLLAESTKFLTCYGAKIDIETGNAISMYMYHSITENCYDLNTNIDWIDIDIS